ncbi:hypothetical protein BKI52_21830 [marine bacterium AO1-C]|nr:hypothetical protein BKI52_21830 [marine bacterium AO1-C]
MMRNLYKMLVLFIFSWIVISPIQSFAQKWRNPDKFHFMYSGTIVEKGVRVPLKIGFYWDNNDGKVAGEISVPGEVIPFTGNYNNTTKAINFDGYDVMGGQKRPRYGYFFGKSVGGKINGKFARYRDPGLPSSFAVKLTKVYKK